MARVITARRADTCGDCAGSIRAGEQINYGGPGAVSHERCKPLESSRGTRRRSGAYASSGARMSSRYGRCEDAPCCGCCD